MSSADDLHLGPSDIGFPYFHLMIRGQQFLVGAPIVKLYAAYKTKCGEHAKDFVQLCTFLVESSLDDLQDAGCPISWVVLEEGEMAILPAGWVFASGC